MGWSQRFDEPITVPGRKPLVTLRDAAQFITALRKAEHDAKEWQAAMQALLLVAEHDGPAMFARIGMMRALQGHKPKGARLLRATSARERSSSSSSFLLTRRFFCHFSLFHLPLNERAKERTKRQLR